MQNVYQSIIDVFSKCKRVLLTTHVHPDGDAIGSAAAMVLGLRQKGIESEVLLHSALPARNAFVFQENGIIHHIAEAGGLDRLALDGYDALLVVDTGTWSQLPGMKKKLEGWNKPKLIVDHHVTQEDWADVKLVETQAGAAGEVVGELLRQWGVKIDKPIATALFLAIASDTGWFQFSNTRPYTLRLAADLMDCGVDTDRMYRAIYQNERAERIKLATRAQESLELLAGGRLAMMTIRARDFLETGADAADTENLINIPLQIGTVEVSILVIEPTKPAPIRVSFRSKGGVDVARFAQRLGGGGHTRAAGAKVQATFQEARERVVKAMLEEMGAGR